MNCYAYPIIFDAMKDLSDNYLSINLYDSFIYIFRKNGYIHIKDTKGEYVFLPSTFNFFTIKPINSITVIKDRYGSVFKEIFDKRYSKAAVLIQRAWKQKK